MRVLRVGESALLLEFDDADATTIASADTVTDAVEAWHAELVRRCDTGELTATELVPAARTVLLDGVTEPETLATKLADWSPPPPATTDTGPLIEVPTRYDGPDLPDVAEIWGTDEAGVITQHTSTEYRVAFCGFAPGFAYLTGLNRDVPRRREPRPAVPAGAVGLAGTYSGIYPRQSPGGWQLIGRTDLVLFDPDRDPPALLQPGTRVRFVPR